MKIFIKIFTYVISLVLISFTIFGTIFFCSSYKTLLEREMKSNENQSRMIAYSLISSVEASVANGASDGNTVADTVRLIANNYINDTKGIVLYDSNHNCLYEKNNRISEEEIKKINPVSGKVSQSIITEGNHFVTTVAGINIYNEDYYLCISDDIQHIYDYRQKMYYLYCIIAIVIILVSGGGSFLLALNFARPINSMSKTALEFAAGDYEKRIIVEGNDELTELMKSFNHMANEIQENIVELEEAARRQEEFTSAFAHELKTPLTSIIGYSDMIRTMEIPDKEKILYADYIYRQGKRLEKLSHSMLAMCGLNDEEPELGRVELKTVFDEAKAMTKFIFAESSCKCSFTFANAAVLGEKDFLVTVVVNLLDNARKACAGMDGAIVRVIGEIQDEVYVIRVEDNGCGIPEDDLEKVKEAFYMVDKSRSRSEGGSGLGLSLCSKIVEYHKGTLKVQSQINKGTQVMVSLPLLNSEGGMTK